MVADFPIASIARALRSDAAALRAATSARRAGLPPWLSRSMDDPDGFAAALFAHESARLPLKSEWGVAADLYHDLVGRHAATDAVAFVGYDSVRGLTPVTYRELHLRTRELRALWHRRGVVAGARVALVLPVGIEWLTALLTALRMGLVIAPLPPRGHLFVQHRLDALQAEHVVTQDAYLPWLGEHAARRLDERSEGRELQVISADQSRYPAAAPALLCFSPYAAEPLVPVEVPAQRVLLGALRDATLVFQARAGQRFAWPGADPLRCQPALLFAQLSLGGTYVDLHERDLRSDPGLVVRAQVHTLGLTNETRDLVLAGRLETASVTTYCRDPSEPLAWASWERLAKLLALREIQGFNVVVSSAFGGSFLFGAPSRALHFLEVWPAPGAPCFLGDLLAPEQPSHAASGVYTPAGPAEPEPLVGRFVIAESEGSYVLAGATSGAAYGYRYPLAEAEQALAVLPWLEHVTVVVRPSGALINDADTVLVGFVDPRRERELRDHEPALVREIERCLSGALGEQALPRRCLLFPLIPRLFEGALDRAWAASELSAGLLARRARHPTFVELSRIRRIVAAQAPAE